MTKEESIRQILRAVDEGCRRSIKILDGRILEIENDLSSEAMSIISAHNLKSLVVYELNAMQESIQEIMRDQG